jgi:hypothetical protein
VGSEGRHLQLTLQRREDAARSGGPPGDGSHVRPGVRTAGPSSISTRLPS